MGQTVVTSTFITLSGIYAKADKLGQELRKENGVTNTVKIINDYITTGKNNARWSQRIRLVWVTNLSIMLLANLHEVQPFNFLIVTYSIIAL